MILNKKYFDIYIILFSLLLTCVNQKPDLSFDTTVAKPTFAENHPKILFDEAHNNSSTTDGLYEPFANILENDGYAVEVNDNVINQGVLNNYDILIIVNAKGDENKFDPAFTKSEQTIIYNWVKGGGSLL